MTSEDHVRARARASDPTALRRRAAEIAALNAEIVELERAKTKAEKERDAAVEIATAARRDCGESWVPHRQRGAGAGRGRAWCIKTRRLYQELLAAFVPAQKLNRVVALCAELFCPAKCAREMELPDEKFGLSLRAEMGAVHQLCAGLALTRAQRVASQQWDGSPIDTDGYIVAPMQLDTHTPDGSTKRERWSGVGAVQISDATSKGEALAVKMKVYDRLADRVAGLQSVLEKKYGAQEAERIINARAGGATLAKLAGGVTATDNASAAIASQRELWALLVEEVKERIGEDEYKKLAPDEQRKLTHVWCVAEANHPQPPG